MLAVHPPKPTPGKSAYFILRVRSCHSAHPAKGEERVPVAQGNVEGGGDRAAGAVQAAGNRVGAAGRDVAQAHGGRQLAGVPSAPAHAQQAVQRLLEQPVPAHLPHAISA